MALEEMWRLLLPLLLGQILSLGIAASSFTSSLIAKLGTDTPLTQFLLLYALLATVYGAIFLRQGRRKLHVKWYWYLLLAFVDVQGNYLVVKAYQYSSITSVTLLDCFTIPWVIILTWAVLRTRYSPWQFLGSAICLIGLCLVIISDVSSSNLLGDSSNPLLGDALVIAGTLCFAASNVIEEFLVKKKDQVEVVMMLGAFGVLVTAIQICIFERRDLQQVNWSPTMILLFFGFSMALFVFYAIAPFVLKMSGSTLFNLSLLTSDMWAVLIRLFFYREQINWIYYLAFGTTTIGLLVYSLTGKTDKDEMNYVESSEGDDASINDSSGDTKRAELREELLL